MKLWSMLLWLSVAAWADPSGTPVKLAQGTVEGTRITIAGEEIWPFKDGNGYPYPDAVIWSVDDTRVPEVVRQCMQQASEVLAQWVTNPHDPIHKALIHAGQFHVPTTFFLWTNDYTRGEAWMTTRYRKAQAWNWNNSLLKWESTVDFKNVQGVEVCHLPSKFDTFLMINSEAAEHAAEENRQSELAPPKWETEADNPLIKDPGVERLPLR